MAVMTPSPTSPSAIGTSRRRPRLGVGRIAVAGLLAVLAAACADEDASDSAAATSTPATSTPATSTPATSAPSTTGPPTTTGPSTTAGPSATAPPAIGTELGPVETIAEGLEVPWAVAFVDRDTLLVTERPGRVRVIEGGRLRDEPVAEVDVTAEGEGGLHGIALHPDFPDERYVYLYYTASDENRVVRHALGADLAFGPEEVIVDDIPRGRFHNGGAIAFGPDDLLHIATGDATDAELAADPDSLAGKILRVRPDGSVPDDNPFSGSPVWSYGHRNPQGLTWSEGGALYASEHGPTGDVAGLCCHDEINLIEPGAFYGWPYRAGLVPAADGRPPATPVEPIASSGEATWAPAGIAALRGTDETHLLVANLAGRQLLRLVVADGDPAAVTDTEVALDDLGRLRAAEVGPDGCLYLTTSNTDGRGRPAAGDDRLLRTCPTG